MKDPVLKMAGHDMPKLFQSLYDIGCCRMNYREDAEGGVSSMVKKVKSHPQFVYVFVSNLKWIGFRTQDEFEADSSLTLVNSPRHMIEYIKRMKGGQS